MFKVSSVNERGSGFEMDSEICRYLFVTELKIHVKISLDMERCVNTNADIIKKT